MLFIDWRALTKCGIMWTISEKSPIGECELVVMPLYFLRHQIARNRVHVHYTQYKDWSTKVPFLLQRLGKQRAKQQPQHDLIDGSSCDSIIVTKEIQRQNKKRKKKATLESGTAVVRPIDLDAMFAEQNDGERLLTFADVV